MSGAKPTLRATRTAFIRAILYASLALAACGQVDDDFDVEATVEFVEVEGGCWRLLAVDGTSYEPVNLANEFRVDGLEVSAVLVSAQNAGSYCQVGELVEIVRIRRR